IFRINLEKVFFRKIGAATTVRKEITAFSPEQARVATVSVEKARYIVRATTGFSSNLPMI
ncbi:hypothetical protein, partial [Paenibacillus macerans]|uniref:hypothetical protein n=1 Tax=Paenibacillus macerans TaxID=44252 RepID=UPI0022E0F1A0